MSVDSPPSPDWPCPAAALITPGAGLHAALRCCLTQHIKLHEINVTPANAIPQASLWPNNILTTNTWKREFEMPTFNHTKPLQPKTESIWSAILLMFKMFKKLFSFFFFFWGIWNMARSQGQKNTAKTSVTQGCINIINLYNLDRKMNYFLYAFCTVKR